MQYVVIKDNVFSFVRHYTGHPSYLVAMNFGRKSSTDDFSVKIDGHTVTKGTLVLSSSKLELGITSEIDLRCFKLRPGEGGCH